MAGKILDGLVKTVESLAELTVVTVVADDGFMTLGADGKVTFASPPGNSTPVKGAYTRINLVDGDVLTGVSAAYAPKDDGTASGIMTFHLQQVAAAQQVVAGNVTVIKEFLAFAGAKVGDTLDGPGRTAPGQ